MSSSDIEFANREGDAPEEAPPNTADGNRAGGSGSGSPADTTGDEYQQSGSEPPPAVPPPEEADTSEHPLEEEGGQQSPVEEEESPESGWGSQESGWGDGDADAPWDPDQPPEDDWGPDDEDESEEDKPLVNIFYILFGRCSDGLILGAWPHPDFTDIEDAEATFKKVLLAAQQRMEPGGRQKLTWQDDRCIALILAAPDGELLFGAVVDADYPERLTFNMLKEVSVAVIHRLKLSDPSLNEHKAIASFEDDHLLSAPMKECLESSANKYQDPANIDKIERLLEKSKMIQDVGDEGWVSVRFAGYI